MCYGVALAAAVALLRSASPAQGRVEYATFTASGLGLKDELNKRATQGWSYVGTVPVQGGTMVVMERPTP